MYLLGSNILIYYLNGDKNVISFIDAFLQKFPVLDIDFYGAREAAYLKRSYPLTFPDALIAATAKVFHLTLISRDKIFKKIVEIKSFYP